MATRVLYASYGSNLREERFMAYIEGGAYCGRSYIGCRDTTPPRGSSILVGPLHLMFARRSTRWQGGGVCFLDVWSGTSAAAGHAPAPADTGTGTAFHHTTPDAIDVTIDKCELLHTPSKAVLRLYDISLSQFNDVVLQENGDDRDAVRELDEETLAKLIAEGAGAVVRDIAEGTYYPCLVYLGQHPTSDLPVLTFTCCPTQFVREAAADGASTVEETLHASSECSSYSTLSSSSACAVASPPVVHSGGQSKDYRGGSHPHLHHDRRLHCKELFKHRDPHESYLSMLREGLIECGFTKAEANEYLHHRVQHSRDRPVAKGT